MDLLRQLRASLVAALLALPPRPLTAMPTSPNEYALKAVFLYNFCHFIDWPDSAFNSRNDPLVIGIVGPDPFGLQLQEAVKGENYHGRPIRVEHFRGPRNLKRCHLLFIPQTIADQMPQVLAMVAGKAVVTVGESDNFLDRGGMIALKAEQNRVRLRINASALRTTRLNVSSKLLKVADIRS